MEECRAAAGRRLRVVTGPPSCPRQRQISSIWFESLSSQVFFLQRLNCTLIQGFSALAPSTLGASDSLSWGLSWALWTISIISALFNTQHWGHLQEILEPEHGTSSPFQSYLSLEDVPRGCEFWMHGGHEVLASTPLGGVGDPILWHQQEGPGHCVLLSVSRSGLHCTYDKAEAFQLPITMSQSLERGPEMKESGGHPENADWQGVVKLPSSEQTDKEKLLLKYLLTADLPFLGALYWSLQIHLFLPFYTFSQYPKGAPLRKVQAEEEQVARPKDGDLRGQMCGNRAQVGVNPQQGFLNLLCYKDAHCSWAFLDATP